MKDLRWGRISLLSTTLFACLAAAPAMAQEGAGVENSDEIVVTANRREERLQDVGISVTALSGDTLDDQNIRTAEDLARLVPGLNSTASSGSGVSTIVIRGVGQTDFSDHQEQPNSTYQDGVYIPFSTAAGLPIFDLQRVEALRGPQGTLFGRNATGGLVHYISNGPEPGFSASLEAAGGSRNLTRVQGFLNNGNDRVAARLGYFYQTQDGIIENAFGDDRGDKEVTALRGQLLFNPSASTEIVLNVSGFNQDGTPPGYIATPSYFDAGGNSVPVPIDVDIYGTGAGNDQYGYRNPYSDLRVGLDDPGVENKRSRTYSATVTHDFGSATLTSITAYGTVESLYREDTDSSPISSFSAGLDSSGEDFQQDLRIDGSTDRLRYTAGLFYLKVTDDSSIYNDYGFEITGTTGAGQTNQNFYSVVTESEAIYGQLEYDLTDRLTAIVGGRYTWDQLQLDFRNQCTVTAFGYCRPFGGATVPVGTTLPGIGPITVNNDGDDWSGKLGLNFQLTDDVLLYASVSKGLKGGGFTVSLSPRYPLDQFAYRPENLFAYEIGEKAQFFDGQLTVNAGAYYYDYQDLQSFLFSGTAVQIINLPAEAYGGEVEVSVRPTATLEANLGIAYSHFEISDVPFVANNAPQRPNNAPEWQMTWGVHKTVALGAGYDLQLGYNGRYVDDIYYNIVNTDAVLAPSYTVHDFSLRLEASENWYVGAYLNNAFDERYIVGAFDVTNFTYLLHSYGEPRTFSIGAGVTF